MTTISSSIKNIHGKKFTLSRCRQRQIIAKINYFWQQVLLQFLMITIFPDIVLSGQNKKATLRKFDGTRNILSWIVLTLVQQLQSHLCTVFSYIGLYNSKYTHVQCWHNGSYSPKRTHVQCCNRYLLKLHRSLFSQITYVHYVVI